MGARREHQVIAAVGGEAGDLLDRERRRWDPAAADEITAHVTVVHPEEAGNLELVVARLRVACERIPPFPLVLGAVEAHAHGPTRGVHHVVHDPAGVWAWLRDFVLAPPLVPLQVSAHAPIIRPGALSPRTAWDELRGADPRLEFRVGELDLVVDDGGRWVSVERFRIEGVTVAPP